MATTAPAQPNVEKLTRQISKENKKDSPIVQELRRQVANAWVLYANYKHYHWQTFGPLFRDLHKLFDGLANDVLPTLDELAERVRMIGQDPPGHLSKRPTWPPSPQPRRIRQCAKWSRRRTGTSSIVIKEMRKAPRSPMTTKTRAPWTSSRRSCRSTSDTNGSCATSSARATDSPDSSGRQQERKSLVFNHEGMKDRRS